MYLIYIFSINREPDLTLDVVTVNTKVPVLYDASKARSVMAETERHMDSLHDDHGDDWEDKVNKYLLIFQLLNMTCQKNAQLSRNVQNTYIYFITHTNITNKFGKKTTVRSCMVT